MATLAGRDSILAATKTWAVARPEPISEPLRTRAHSPFWSLSKRTVEALEPDGRGPWYSREAWWNLFPLGWGDTNQSPDEGLWMAQVDHVAALFWAIVDALDPDRIVILAGKGYWDAMASAMGLADLPRMERPLIAGGSAIAERSFGPISPAAQEPARTRSRRTKPREAGRPQPERNGRPGGEVGGAVLSRSPERPRARCRGCPCGRGGSRNRPRSEHSRSVERWESRRLAAQPEGLEHPWRDPSPVTTPSPGA